MPDRQYIAERKPGRRSTDTNIEILLLKVDYLEKELKDAKNTIAVLEASIDGLTALKNKGIGVVLAISSLSVFLGAVIAKLVEVLKR